MLINSPLVRASTAPDQFRVVVGCPGAVGPEVDPVQSAGTGRRNVSPPGPEQPGPGWSREAGGQRCGARVQVGALSLRGQTGRRTPGRADQHPASADPRSGDRARQGGHLSQGDAVALRGLVLRRRAVDRIRDARPRLRREAGHESPAEVPDAGRSREPTNGGRSRSREWPPGRWSAGRRPAAGGRRPAAGGRQINLDSDSLPADSVEAGCGDGAEVTLGAAPCACTTPGSSRCVASLRRVSSHEALTVAARDPEVGPLMTALTADLAGEGYAPEESFGTPSSSWNATASASSVSASAKRWWESAGSSSKAAEPRSSSVSTSDRSIGATASRTR